MAKKAVGIHEVDPIMSLSAQVFALANQIAAFTTRDSTRGYNGDYDFIYGRKGWS